MRLGKFLPLFLHDCSNVMVDTLANIAIYKIFTYDLKVELHGSSILLQKVTKDFFVRIDSFIM